MSSSRIAAGPGARESARRDRLTLLLFLVLLGSLLGQSSLALALSPVEIWHGGIYDDAPQADIPMASSQLAALPCAATAAFAPARAVGTVIGGPEGGCPAPVVEVSRSRAPPLG